jgi:hypothetical protein
MITGVTSHVLQVGGAARVICDGRRRRPAAGWRQKGVIRRRQPSVAGQVVVAVTVVAIRCPGRDLLISRVRVCTTSNEPDGNLVCRASPVTISTPARPRSAAKSPGHPRLRRTPPEALRRPSGLPACARPPADP